MEDINSLLVDLLNIIEIWLKIDENSLFTNAQLLMLIKMFDAKSVKRTTQAIKCVCFALEKAFRIKKTSFLDEQVCLFFFFLYNFKKKIFFFN